jgi:viroplasmin and RNaseH domain-containing protein
MKYYAVKVGRVPAIYSEDEDWYYHIEGLKNAEYKEFDDIEEARKYMRSKITTKKSKSKYKGSKLSVIKAKKNWY